MTLSTKADHERGREIGYVIDEVTTGVNPEARAEEYAMGLEGTESDPAVVDDPKWRARQVADEVERDAEDFARCFTDSDSVAEYVGRALGEDAYDAVRDELRASPCVEVVGHE